MTQQPTRTTLYVGAKLGRLTLRQRTNSFNNKWVCDCDCGLRVSVPQAYLTRRPNPKVNCGYCADLKTSKTTHNNEYRIWTMMLQRTTNPKHVSYRFYGGKGIKVCEEWSNPIDGFDKFLQHIGPRPSKSHSVDRYPNNLGNYEPNNVRWATSQEQSDNTPRNQAKHR
jgi:hypothetical protein